jgi:acetyl-CoA carboxylase carboxyltransferase component
MISVLRKELGARDGEAVVGFSTDVTVINQRQKKQKKKKIVKEIKIATSLLSLNRSQSSLTS